MALALETGLCLGGHWLGQMLSVWWTKTIWSSRMTGLYIDGFLGAITNCGDIKRKRSRPGLLPGRLRFGIPRG